MRRLAFSVLLEVVLFVACNLLRAESAYWSVNSGSCTKSGDCIQSTDYPYPYPHDDACSIVVETSDWSSKEIYAEHFHTEGCCDMLTINGVGFSGVNSPTGRVPTGTISWSSDNQQAPQQGGWRLCPQDVVTTDSADSSSSSDSGNMPVIIGAVVGGLAVIAAVAGGCFWLNRSMQRSPGPGKSAPSPGGAPLATVKVVGAAFTEVEASGTRSTWIDVTRSSSLLATWTAAVGAAPQNWVNKSGDFNSLEPVISNGAEEAAMQSMMDHTFKQIKTRDRTTGGLPTRLKVANVLRIENSEMWKKYSQGRHCIKNKRSSKYTPVSQYGGPILTHNDLPPALKKALDFKVNEIYLWHGTSPAGAKGIAADGFKLKFSGSNAGIMYGSGIYLAECASKSDEYAKDDEAGIHKGLYCLLLCRVVLGEMLHLTTGGDAVHDTIKSAINSSQYDSVLGDREASVGTYREFVAYMEDQVYPEYLILYKREY